MGNWYSIINDSHWKITDGDVSYNNIIWDTINLDRWLVQFAPSANTTGLFVNPTNLWWLNYEPSSIRITHNVSQLGVFLYDAGNSLIASDTDYISNTELAITKTVGIDIAKIVFTSMVSGNFQISGLSFYSEIVVGAVDVTIQETVGNFVVSAVTGLICMYREYTPVPHSALADPVWPTTPQTPTTDTNITTERIQEIVHNVGLGMLSGISKMVMDRIPEPTKIITEDPPEPVIPPDPPDPCTGTLIFEVDFDRFYAGIPIKTNVSNIMKLGDEVGFTIYESYEISCLTLLLKKINAPQGNIWIEIYEDDGTGKPGTLLITSSLVACADLSDTDNDATNKLEYEQVKFEFADWYDGWESDKIYVIDTDYSHPAFNDYIMVGYRELSDNAYVAAIDTAENWESSIPDQYGKLLFKVYGQQANSIVENCTILPVSGTEMDATDLVTITCATPDITIYYTTDGSVPDTGDNVYSAPFQLGSNISTIKARAFKSGMWDPSAVAEVVYDIEYLTYSYYGPDARIQIATYDDTNSFCCIQPNISSYASWQVKNYNGYIGSRNYCGVALFGTCTERTAMEVMFEDVESYGTYLKQAKVKLRTYNDLTVSGDGQTVDIFLRDHDNPDHPIDYYDFEAMPLTNAYMTYEFGLAENHDPSTTYVIDVTNLLSKVMSRPGWSSGNNIMIVFRRTALTATWGMQLGIHNADQQQYTLETKFTNELQGTVATPTISPVSGSTIAHDTDIIISCNTSDVSIYYTTDGSTPDSNSNFYDGPFTTGLPNPTIKAIAIKPAYTDSGVLTATYIAPLFVQIGYNTDDTGGLSHGGDQYARECYQRGDYPSCGSWVGSTGGGVYVCYGSLKVYGNFWEYMSGACRFTGIEIAQGTTIISCKVSMIPQSNYSGTNSVNCYFENTVNGTQPIDVANMNTIDGNLTSAIGWTQPAMTWDRFYESSELKTIVQGIINNGSWVSGNDLTFFIKGGAQKRHFYGHNEITDARRPFIIFET